MELPPVRATNGPNREVTAQRVFCICFVSMFIVNFPSRWENYQVERCFIYPPISALAQRLAQPQYPIV
jgi:hypothetical protein